MTRVIIYRYGRISYNRIHGFHTISRNTSFLAVHNDLIAAHLSQSVRNRISEYLNVPPLTYPSAVEVPETTRETNTQRASAQTGIPGPHNANISHFFANGGYAGIPVTPPLFEGFWNHFFRDTIDHRLARLVAE